MAHLRAAGVGRSQSLAAYGESGVNPELTRSGVGDERAAGPLSYGPEEPPVLPARSVHADRGARPRRVSDDGRRVTCRVEVSLLDAV